MKAYLLLGISTLFCMLLSACVAPEYGFDEVSQNPEPMFAAKDAATTSQMMIRPLV